MLHSALCYNSWSVSAGFLALGYILSNKEEKALFMQKIMLELIRNFVGKGMKR